MGCVLLLSLLGCILAGNGVAGSSWLLGCYYVNQTLDEGSLLDGVSVRLQTGSVVECGEACIREGFAYMGLHSRERCSCYNVTTLQTLHQQGLKQILPEYCNISCTGDGVSLPCGGHRLDHLGKELVITPVSLYLAAGPYLTAVTLEVDADWVVVHTPFAIEAVASLADFLNISEEWALTNKSGLEIRVSWTVGDHKENETVAAWGRRLKSRIPFTFSQTGNYTVEVKVSNVISSISTQTLVNVINPEPKDLQLALLTAEEYRPSCTPKKCDIRPGTAAVAVFANYTSSIEASVSVGANLTFVLEYGDDGSVYEHRPSDDTPNCEERNCTSVVQDHVFREIGVYNVTVTVSNVYNTVQEVMTVVVVNHSLSNLSMSLHQDSPQLVTPLQPVKFLLKLETASRRDTGMELVISSNNRRIFTVQEFNTSALALSKPDRAVIAASYGEGCTLEVNLDHVFVSEGQYRPVIMAFNNVSNITAQSSDPVLVVQKISGPRLHAASVTALNASTTYHVDFEVKSRNMSITWSILTRSMTPLYTVVDASPTWTYTFTAPGHYVVAVSASNIQGNVSTWAPVYVQVPVTGLSLTQPSQFHATLGYTLSLSATIESGSDVEFTWNFSDASNPTDVIDKNFTTNANHTYFKAGKYNVSLIAQNNVSHEVVSLPELFSVQQKVTFVALQSTEPTALGNATIFLSIIDKGTDIHFDFDFGQGRGREPGKGEHKTKRKYFVTHFFSRTGIHQVKVFAYNLVSEVTSQIDVIVEEPAPQFVIEVVGPIIANRSVVLAAMKGGDVIQRPDLIYTWYVGNDRDKTVKTRSPLLFWTFPDAGSYNVSLEAGNRLEPFVFDREVTVEDDEGQLSLHHCGVAEVNQSCRFSIQGNVSGTANVTVEYQNDVSSPEERTVNPSGWSIVFKQSGLHRVFVRGEKKDDQTGKTQEFELFSFFIVEEAIGGLQLKGPQVVALHSFVIPRRYVWEALLDQGSHVIYVWALGNNRSLPTTYREYAQRFVERGTYVLFLELFNDVSRVMANLTIVAQYSIVDVEAVVPAVVLHVATNISLVVEGGREFFVHVSFGDETDRLFSSEDRALMIQTVSSQDSDAAAPEHRVVIPHVYESIGLYDVSVNVSNMLSWKTLSKSARVEEPITGVVIQSNSPPVIPVGDTVEISVTVESGTDLSFKWRFSNRPDSTSVSSNATASVANHTFSSQGTFVVSVEIKNPYVQAPVVATLKEPIQVVQPVVDITLEVKNAVELISFKGNWSTEDVVITASCYDCSHVTFAFDFGDGTSQSVEGLEDSFFFMTGETTHRYTAVGVYPVSVTAFTPLNNLTSKPQLLYVQVAPRDLRLDHAIYKTRFGNDTHFVATVIQGTNVTIDWKFGDDQEKLDGGLEVTHRYLNRGTFNVSVTARNRVASPEDSARVYVQYPIQGVDLHVNATLVASGETVEFTATPYPPEFANDNSFVGWYIWKLDSLSSNDPQTTENTIKHTYSYARKNKTRETVTVTAANFVSNATSKPLDLYVLSKVTFLQMQYSGIPLLNHTLTFTMSTYSGSELNYTWDFGDGSPVVSGYVQTINHTFTRVGEYEVVGYVENALSNATVKETIFILETPCAPPQITILPHLPGSQEQYIIERSKEVKIELETKVSCSITHAMAYTWTLLNETTGEAVDIQSVNPQVFRERTLYFPPRTLNYGNYTVHLEVKMNGTIVYSKVDIKLGIVASLLTSVIRGGILREISPQDMVVLNGADSRDPDFENSTGMNYRWTCYRLKDPDEGCFAENISSVLDPTHSILQFPGHLLWPNKSGEEFVFNLTVSKPGRKPHTATQTLRLSDAHAPRALHIQITCPVCLDGLVNNNERLAMKAVCENCGAEDELLYTWSVYRIAGQDGLIHDDSDDDGGHKCEPQAIAAARESLKVEDPGDVPKEPTATATRTVAPPIPVVNSTEIPGLFKPKEASSDGRNARRRKRRDREPEEPEDPIPLPEPGTAGSARFLGPNRRQDYVPPVPSETGSSVMEKGQFVSTISEGRDETGSTGGRSGSGFHEGVGNGRNNPGGNQNREEPPQGEPVVDTNQPTKAVTPQKLPVEQHKTIFEPEAKYLKTGYNKEVFILKPGALSQGRQYIFIVQVTKKGEPLTKGESWVLVVVNQSPSRGICTVPNSQSPSFSYELEEKFQVYCKEWQDKDHGPLSYEVSYRLGLEEDEPYNLIYRGLNTKMEFRLPAGKGPEHKVFVRILISDNFGASTRACNITLEVRPREQSYGNETVEQQLYNEVSRSDSTLGVFISQKDYSNTRVFANYLTLSLNRLEPTPAAAKSTRQEVRHTLLSLLNSFPIRDEYELWQTIQPVVQLTKVVEELDKRCIDQATQLLQKIATEAQVIYKNRDHGASDLLRYIVDVSSNIMAASGLVHLSSHEQMSTLPPRVTTTKEDESIASVTWVIDTILKGQLQSRYVGEEAIQWSSSYISVFANRYGSMKGPLIQMGDASCSLPADMSLVLPAKPTGTVQLSTSPSLHLPATNDNCYEAHMITFHENPFSLQAAKNKDVQVNSKVTSLKVMDCHGEEVKVKNLSRSNMVKIEIPQKQPEREPSSTHTLNKWQMNVHQFNITEKNFNQSLHIQVELVPVSRGRLFSIAALIRCGAPPSPDLYLLKKDFRADQNTLPLFLPAGTLNGTGPCYMGLVDSRYDAGRPRPQDVRERVYSLRTWWGRCLFWDTALHSWSGEGCHTTANSTLNSTVCLCSHMTMFASHLDLAPNDLHFKDIEDFFELYKSAVMFAWIAALLVVYVIAVLFCRRIDLHNARKGGVVYLQDNAVTDHQKYEITLETGFRKGAGTTAKISIILHGEDGMSETRELISGDDRPLFERNSRDTFVMTLPDNIGKIWKVQLWHNNAGASPSWYLSRVVIRDISCGNTYYFICEKWLAVEEDEGKVEGEFMSLEGNLGFKKVFWAKGTQYATDLHLWASVVTCPSYSRFTRVQRLTCCLSLLMSYMCLNAMWYRDRIEQYRGEFGLLDLSWRAVVVGAIITAIVLPVNLFLVFLFRRSKVDDRHQSKEDVYRTGKCEHLDESAEEAVQPVMTYSILDQSLLNWQSIQEWAQKQWVKRQQSEVSSSESVKNSPQIQHTKKSETLEQASSGFEDCASQDRIQPTPDRKKCDVSDISSSKGSQTSTGGHRRRPFLLPSCCRYLAWTLAVIIIVGCAVVTMMYGFRFGKTKSTRWLQSFYFSFMVCVFISHPFLILIVAVYTSIKYRNDPSIFDHPAKRYHERQKSENVDAKECVYCEECDELERGVVARQRSRYLRFARPPQEKHLIEARKKIMKEKKAYAVLQDYWQFLVFFIVLATMAYGKDLSSPFYINESLKNSLVRNGSPQFTAIKTVTDWWSWSQTGLLDGLFSHVAYDRDAITPHETTNLYVIGQVHVRQLRVNAPITCESVTHNTLLNTCHDQYSTDSRDQAPYGPNESWHHSFYQQYYNVRGSHGTYDSSGYVVKLHRNRTAAYQQLEELRANDWLDVRTRAVVVEFTIFYAPTSLFTSVTLLLETPSTGGAFPRPSITSTYLYKYISVWDNMVLAAELFFIAMVLYSVSTVVVEVITLQHKYFTNPWSAVDVVFSLMALAYIGCYIYRVVLVSETTEHLLTTYYEEFVDISTLAHWDEILKAMVGFLLAVVTIKFLYLLRYKRTFSNLGNFYKRAYRELFVFSAMFLVFLLAYTSLGYAAFGAFSSGFRDFWVGMETMAGLLIGCYNIPEFEGHNMIGARLFIVTYLLVVTGILTCYIVAVLSYQYKIFRQGEMIAMGCSDTLKFFWERFLLWAGIKRPLPEDEPESDLPPEFTMAEIEYQVDELLFRMNAISGSSNLPEKPPCYFIDSDVTYGVGDDGISSGESSEPRPFDEERFEQRIQKIEENLYSQEPYLAQLIKLDSIGADVLSHEREKQLRSHLELEIFRRLQMQREQRLRSSDRSSSSGGSLSLPVGTSSRQASPSGGISGRKATSLYTRHLRPIARSESSLVKPPDDLGLGTSDHPNLQTILAPNEDTTDVSRDTTNGEGGFPEHLIREALSRDFGVEFELPRARHPQVEKTKSDSTSGHSSSASDEWRQHRAETTTTSSEDNTHVTGAGARAKIKHGGQPKVKPETATPSSAKVFSHSSLRDLPPIEVTKTSIIGSPGVLKRKPPPGSFSLMNPNFPKQGPSGIHIESSSGSEQDAYRGKRPSSKARTLRKTKSRGKGKGGKRLPTLDSLEDDLSFEHDGYNTDTMYGTSSTSESSKDKSSSSSENKQAWL